MSSHRKAADDLIRQLKGAIAYLEGRNNTSPDVRDLLILLREATA